MGHTYWGNGTSSVEGQSSDEPEGHRTARSALSIMGTGLAFVVSIGIDENVSTFCLIGGV